jgi:hypothetical protein
MTPNNAFIDCDGLQYDWLRNFRRKEFYMNSQQKLGILPYDKNIKNIDIPIDMKASQELSKLFKPEPIASTLSANHTLHEGLFY